MIPTSSHTFYDWLTHALSEAGVELHPEQVAMIHNDMKHHLSQVFLSVCISGARAEFEAQAVYNRMFPSGRLEKRDE
jgi:hypothetical protein